MKTFTLATLTLALGASVAFATTTNIDANEDGEITMDELVVVYDDISTDTFSQADTDDNGTLSVEEFAAAQEAGLIPSEM
ncbi:EF-hand domain-containing protein [Aliiroseovarius sp. KMU-50]|uniref:EF-hand domain-containing protein n=1 Tax=Aliiroseovarius salicola TaxID=3009082 RepID=A0ABT4VYN7_9RHOB|nr:EF-hand domain-containing protein [Aliiroseovarius sp. KMU-50]MDA5092687.1 EF-hand domain-containing protein [Aliiroseovarius sp. KMU-50]